MANKILLQPLQSLQSGPDLQGLHEGVRELCQAPLRQRGVDAQHRLIRPGEDLRVRARGGGDGSVDRWTLGAEKERQGA